MKLSFLPNVCILMQVGKDLAVSMWPNILNQGQTSQMNVARIHAFQIHLEQRVCTDIQPFARAMCTFHSSAVSYPDQGPGSIMVSRTNSQHGLLFSLPNNNTGACQDPDSAKPMTSVAYSGGGNRPAVHCSHFDVHSSVIPPHFGQIGKGRMKIADGNDSKHILTGSNKRK